jgi:hypothetical protein
MELRAWTNSAIPELDDAPGQAAPIREATIVGYDGGERAIAIVDGKTVRIEIRLLYMRPRAAKKAPAAVAAKPPPRRSPSIAVDSAYVRIKNSRADSKEIYERIRGD